MPTNWQNGRGDIISGSKKIQNTNIEILKNRAKTKFLNTCCRRIFNPHATAKPVPIALNLRGLCTVCDSRADRISFEEALRKSCCDTRVKFLTRKDIYVDAFL